MDSITTPDEYGGLWPGDHVSFIVVPARKGIQAIEVTLEDPPKPEGDKGEDGFQAKMGRMNIRGGDDVDDTVAYGKENRPPIAEADADDAGAWDLSSWGT